MLSVHKSRDYYQYHSEFGAPELPFEREGKKLKFSEAIRRIDHFASENRFSLSGEWKLLQGNNELSDSDYLYNNDVWKDAICAKVPGSIQDVLLKNGLIDDPMLGKNNLDIEWVAESKWWYKKTFGVPEKRQGETIQLFFAGVDYEAEFWLNGTKLGGHEGMFGGPEYDVTDILNYNQSENTLIVCIAPAPSTEEVDNWPLYFKTLKASVVFGWHYVKLISLGIWQDVFLIRKKEIYFETNPFITTIEVGEDKAKIGILLDITSKLAREKNISLEFLIEPSNFKGKSFASNIELCIRPGNNTFCFESELAGVSLWWPYDMGYPSLYSFDVKISDNDGLEVFYHAKTGIRKVELIPTLIEINEKIYDWQFVINGHKQWIKGANWASPDPLLRYDRKRYERFLLLARNANINLLRTWGGGPIETDIFYDLCDEMGIMVWQEFPMHHGHLTDDIPLELGEDIAVHVVPRLRNRASLVVWCGANEQYHPTCRGTGKIIDHIGKRFMELDGTRTFRKSCPYGGDIHEYITYWDGKHILDNLSVLEDFQAGEPRGCAGVKLANGPVAVTEWGVSSPANIVTLERVIPKEKLESWPLKRDGVFVHHTPTYDPIHIDKMIRCASIFINVNSLEDMVIGSQICQSQDYKFVIERMRSKKPYTTATFFYKLTENYPACSWATIDYYGAPKRSHYAIRHAYQPLHIMALCEKWEAGDEGLDIMLMAVNDTLSVVYGTLEMKIYDSTLKVISHKSYDVFIDNEKGIKIDQVNIKKDLEGEELFFIYMQIKDSDNSVLDTNWYSFNFEKNPSVLWNIPMAEIKCTVSENSGKLSLKIRNESCVPAIDVCIETPGADYTYFAEDNIFWIEPFGEKTVELAQTEAVDGLIEKIERIRITANNMKECEITI